MPNAVVEKVIIRCVWCDEERETGARTGGDPALPKRWKRRPGDDAAACDKCWKQRYGIRAISFLVAQPVGCEWKAFRDVLKEACHAAARAANAVVLACVKADFTRKADMEKPPKIPDMIDDLKRMTALSHVAKAACPEMDASAAESVAVRAAASFKRLRYEVLWRQSAALPTFRSPQPYPIRDGAWKPRLDQDGGALIEVTLLRQRFTLRMKKGAGWVRSLRAFDRIVRGTVKPCDMRLMLISRSNGKPSEVRCIVTAWFPKGDACQRSGTVFVRGTPDSFLVMEDRDSTVLWTINADWMKDKIIGHSFVLQRMSEDLKRPRGGSGSKAGLSARTVEDVRAKRALKCDRQNARLQAFSHETTSAIAERAARMNVAEVSLDLRAATYLPRFPWFRWREMLTYKLGSHGILLRVQESKADEKESDEALAN